MTSLQSTDDAAEGTVYRTVFSVRYYPEEDTHELEVFYTYEDPGDATMQQLKDAAAMAARITGGYVQDHPAVYIAKALSSYWLRMRLNPNILGVYLLVTEGFIPTEDYVLAYWRANKTTLEPFKL